MIAVRHFCMPACGKMSQLGHVSHAVSQKEVGEEREH